MSMTPAPSSVADPEVPPSSPTVNLPVYIPSLATESPWVPSSYSVTLMLSPGFAGSDTVAFLVPPAETRSVAMMPTTAPSLITLAWSVKSSFHSSTASNAPSAPSAVRSSAPATATMARTGTHCRDTRSVFILLTREDL